MVPQFLKGEEETLVRVTPFPIKGVRFPHEGAPFPAWVHRFLTEGASIPKRVGRAGERTLRSCQGLLQSDSPLVREAD